MFNLSLLSSDSHKISLKNRHKKHGIKAVPSRTIWRRSLMVRQPYSVAVPSTGGRLHPRFLRKRGLGRRWSSPCRRDGEVEKTPFFNGKEGRDDFRKKNIKTQYHDE